MSSSITNQPVQISAQGPGSANQSSEKKGSLVGRFIRWLNDTSSGRCVKTIGWSAAGVGMIALAIALSIKAVVALIFAVGALGTTPAVAVAGLAFGISIAAGIGVIASIGFAIAFLGNAKDNYQEMNRLAFENK